MAYFSGQGRVYIGARDETGNPQGLVYVGNVPGHAGENTVCPNCKRLLVRRTGYQVEDIALRGTFCSFCGHNINVRTSLARGGGAGGVA